ncbi:SpaA isopeptide-forming pilin-related protein [Massiliimalia massiliensis]|uniref:SpaA isopeptide-forming pilin-related protein n=1 Tax=Massiliimalia massiliensis TaxID=1852384 RepID=UPI0009FB92FF|nr:SpaA isopeptide-forming pilin-related protein [Massiliimalia massiliensis]
MNTRKNITRRVLSLLLALFIILPVCTFQGGLQVSAASVSGTIAKSWISGYYFDFTGVGLPCGSHRGQASMLKVNGKPAYCIELGEQVYTGDYTFKDAYNKLSTAEKKLLQYTLIYGYTGSVKYGYSKNVEYYATQILCWIIENGYYNNSSKSTEIINAACKTNPDKSDIKACITKMRTQIDDHAVIPSFAKSSSSSAATQSLKYSGGKYTLTLTDKNGAAKYYDWSDFKSKGIAVSVSGNKVTFTASKIFTGTKNCKLTRTKSQYLSSISEVAPMYLASSSNQDLVVHLNQYADPVTAYLKLNVAAGDLIVSKTAEDGAKSGFKFQVTGNGIDETVTTGSNGKATLSDIPAGKYTVKESSVNDKYVTPAQQTVTVPAGSSVTASFTNKLKKFQVSLVKKDSESSSNPQGNASLDGAVYGLYEKDGTLLEKLITSNGGKASSSYYPCQDGAYIQEITPPKGYLKDSTKYTLKAGSANFTIEKNTISQTVADDVITGRIAVAKKKEIPDPESGTDVDLSSEENAEFQIYLKSAGSYDKAKETERDILKTDSAGYDQSKELPYGTYVLHQTKGDETTKFVDREITISENGKIYFYDLLNELKKARIKIIKIDSSTGNAIPMSGIKVKIKNLTTGKWVIDHGKEIFESTEDGTIELSVMLYVGKYEIYEVEAPESFAFLTEPLEFEIKAEDCDKTVTVNLENTPQKGRIALYKEGEVITGADMVQTELGILTQPIYETRVIGGAVYNIEAAEDIVIGNVVRHKKGDVIETLTTKKGEAVYSGYLYPGNYVLVEQTPPDDMLLDSTPIPFTITDDEAAEVIQPDLEITAKDNRPAVEISLQKSMEQDEHYQIGMYGEYQNIRFGLFTGEDVLDYDGNLAIPKDTLMFVCGIDDESKGKFNMPNIPLAKMYVKEIATDEHYILSDQQYPVEPARDNADQNGMISILVNDGEEIGNEIIRGKIEGMKIDQNGEPLPHTVFGLFRADEQDLDKDHALYVTESEKDGSFVFDGVPFGIYQLYELERVYGYEALTEPIMVEITEDGQVIELEVENTLIIGSAMLSKLDSEFPDTLLTGAEFEIIADSNQNKKYDPEDQVVGTMTETEEGTYQYSGLLEGGYFCHEAAPPEQFLADENYYYFEIRENGEVAEIKNADKGFTNKPETGELWITKTDVSNGKPLANVGFRIRNIETGEIAAEGYTGKDGVVKFKLRIGKYTYQEFDPLDGYRIDSRQFPFEIREDGQIIKAEMTNEKTEVPKTGDSPVLMIAASILILGSGLILLVLWSRKRKGR